MSALAQQEGLDDHPDDSSTDEQCTKASGYGKRESLSGSAQDHKGVLAGVLKHGKYGAATKPERKLSVPGAKICNVSIQEG